MGTGTSNGFHVPLISNRGNIRSCPILHLVVSRLLSAADRWRKYEKNERIRTPKTAHEIPFRRGWRLGGVFHVLEKTFGLQRSDMSKPSGVSAGTKQTILRCRQGAADLSRSKYSGELLISTNIYFEGESKAVWPRGGLPQHCGWQWGETVKQQFNWNISQLTVVDGGSACGGGLGWGGGGGHGLPCLGYTAVSSWSW